MATNITKKEGRTVTYLLFLFPFVLLCLVHVHPSARRQVRPREPGIVQVEGVFVVQRRTGPLRRLIRVTTLKVKVEC